YLRRGVMRHAATLLRRRKTWYFNVAVGLSADIASPAQGVLGIDLGENVLAATSAGALYGGASLRDRGERYNALRARLQRNGSQSARQLLARVSGRERRHAKHVNHQISAKIIRDSTAQNVGVIVLENLTNIRANTNARKRIRARLAQWS